MCDAAPQLMVISTSQTRPLDVAPYRLDSRYGSCGRFGSLFLCDVGGSYA